MFNLEKAIKCYRGYNLIFNKGSNLSLDKDFVPIMHFRDDGNGRLYHNMRRFYGAYPESAYPMMALCAALFEKKLPYEGAYISDDQGSDFRMHYEMLIEADVAEQVHNLVAENSMFELTNDLEGTPLILDKVVLQNISPWTYLKFCNEVMRPDLTDYEYAGLRLGNWYGKIKQLVRLDQKHLLWKNVIEGLIVN